MYCPSGTYLTYVASFDSLTFYNQTVTDAVQQAAATLKNQYNLIIAGVQTDQGTDIGGGGTITLNLLTQMDRGDEADIQSNVDDAFAALGNAVSESSISVNSAATGSSSSASDNTYDSCSSLSDKIQNALPTWLGGSPVTQNQQNCYTKSGQTQIQDVSKNAAAAYGAGSTVATATAGAASTQSAQVAGDVAAIADKARKDAASSDKTQLYLIAGGVLAVVVVIALIRFA